MAVKRPSGRKRVKQTSEPRRAIREQQQASQAQGSEPNLPRTKEREKTAQNVEIKETLGDDDREISVRVRCSS